MWNSDRTSVATIVRTARRAELLRDYMLSARLMYVVASLAVYLICVYIVVY